MLNAVLYPNCSGLRYQAFSTACLKAVLLFFLLINQAPAEDVVAQISHRLAKSAIIQGEFQQQKRLKILKKPLLSTGTFTYQQTKGVIWKTLTPVPSLLLLNDRHLLTSQGEQAIPAAFGRVFQAMLGGNLHLLSDNFALTGTDRSPSWQLELTPKDELLQKIMRVIVLSGDQEVRSLEIEEVGGNHTRIYFANITHPTHLLPEQEAAFERLSP